MTWVFYATDLVFFCSYLFEARRKNVYLLAFINPSNFFLNKNKNVISIVHWPVFCQILLFHSSGEVKNSIYLQFYFIRMTLAGRVNREVKSYRLRPSEKEEDLFDQLSNCWHARCPDYGYNDICPDDVEPTDAHKEQRRKFCCFHYQGCSSSFKNVEDGVT